ncbi:uncharacterized protein [Apostichopus japonicus]|uniref:uncharacterized protein n=1 Tax=Stichopus japonicus TaxID=307972 RepID=UPI003AB7C06B
MSAIKKAFALYVSITVLIFITAKFSAIEDLSYLAPRPRPPSKVKGHVDHRSNTIDFAALDKFAGTTVILTFTNAAFVPFARNWIEYLRRLPNLPTVVVIAEDTVAYDAMKQYPEVSTVLTKQLQSPLEKSQHLSKDNIKLTNKRPTYIKKLLDKNINVLFSDVDTIWLDNPLPYLAGEYDVILQEDNPYPELTYSVGFIYFKATDISKMFVNQWMEQVAKYRDLKPDQKVLNVELESAVHLKKKILDTELFPNGKNFFERTWRMKHRIRPVVIHNNWVETLQDKFDRYDKMGLWLIQSPIISDTK